MKLTQFHKLRRAVDALDPDLIRKRLKKLDAQLLDKGLPFDPANTVVTQEGIFYIEPESGIATKVMTYISDFPAELSEAQRKMLSPEGYSDKESIERFHPYHLMQCNTLMVSERNGWLEPYRITKRTDGKVPFRITAPIDKKRKTAPEVYQVILRQQLYVCKYCFIKVRSILEGMNEEKREDFQAQKFFDVNLLHSWNSYGLLSKDFGFTTDMYPDDWLNICAVRKRQGGYRCEACCDDLSDDARRRYLCVTPTDHIVAQEGYTRLECTCVACLAEMPAYAEVKTRPEYREYMALRGTPLAEVERAPDILSLLRESAEG